MNKKKTMFIFITVSLLLIAAIETLYISTPSFMKKINNTLIDTAFRYRGSLPADERIVIVDVDEKSLQTLGQWPWSRDKIATILQNLTDAGVAIIGLDMVFSEKDKSSPVNIAKELNISADTLPDYDRILAHALQNTPTVAGYVFDFDKEIHHTPPQSDAIYIERGKSGDTLQKAKGVITNIPLLQQSAAAGGSFNTVPDDDGIIRYVPLLFSYDDTIYPSLSFEMVRLLSGVRKVDILYDENGITQINLDQIQIPVNSQGKLFVNYRGGQKSYRYLSAVDIYDNRFDKSDIEGNIVLLGTSAAGLLDLRATPFDNVYPGVEVHANVIDNIINDDMIADISTLNTSVTMAAVALIVLITGTILLYTPPFVSILLLPALFTFTAYGYYYTLFQKKLLLNFSFPAFSMLISLIAFTFLKVYFENRQKKAVTQKFAKKVSPQVAKQLLQQNDDLFAISEEEISIFFSDIRNFTTISESFADPKLLIEYLNTYMSPMSEIIIEEEGTIDKYIGDAIMAYWNAPLRVPHHADKAVTAALKQIKALGKLNVTLQKKAFPPIAIGIGIHTGKAIVGEMGSSGRSDYTVIGDSVNLASRIEGLCKTYGAKILISETTKNALEGKYRIVEVDRVQVKGKNEAVTLYEVIGFGTFEAEEAREQKQYAYAKRLYREARFAEALTLFEQLYRQKQRKLYALYVGRCREYMKKEIKDFDAIHRFTTK